VDFLPQMKYKVDECMLALRELEARNMPTLVHALEAPTVLLPEIQEMLRLRAQLAKDIERAGIFCVRTNIPPTKATMDELNEYLHTKQAKDVPVFDKFWRLVQENLLVDTLIGWH
jgi:hypothetical protein